MLGRAYLLMIQREFCLVNPISDTCRAVFWVNRYSAV